MARRGELELVVEEEFGRSPAHRPEPGMDRMEEAARLLAAAQRPVIVAGRGVVVSDAAAELRQLAEKLSIPVLTSLNGNGLLPGDHSLAIGVTGKYSRWCATRLASEADLVFFIGTRAGALVTDSWQFPRPGTDVIQLDIDPAEIGRNYPVRVGLPGDARTTLRRLLEAVQVAIRPDWVRHAQGLLEQWRAEMAPRMASDDVPIRPERICKEITNFLPENGVLVVDTGHAAIWSGTLVEFNRPGQSYLRCSGTLGWAFPAAIGVKCALPDRPVLCFAGDGAFYYHMAELETAVRMGINLVVLVNNNAALSQETPAFLDHYRDYYGARGHDRGREMWFFRRTDLAIVAEASGCVGMRVERPDQLGPALEQAFAANRPVLIDVIADAEVIAPGARG